MDLNRRFAARPGRLSQLANIRSYPNVPRVGIDQIEWNKVDLEIHYGNKELMRQNIRAWGRLALYHVSHFYLYNVPDTDFDNMTSRKLARALVGILLSMGDANSIIRYSDLDNSLSESGINADFRLIDVQEVRLLNSHHYNDFVEDLKAKGLYGVIINNPDAPLVMMCVIILCMVKVVNIENAERWMKNRLRTFAGGAGDQGLSAIWEETLPNRDYLNKLQSFMSSNFKLRRSCFLIILELSQLEFETSVVKLCRDIIQLMRGTELHHLVLIDEYIMKKYRELQGFHPINDVQISFDKALARLEKEQSCDVLFIKLLYPKDQTAELNRQNFRIAAIVATTCARFENPTFENYYMDRSEKAQRISAIVEEYLSHRLSLSKIRVGEMEVAYLGPSYEKNMYFDLVISQFKKKKIQTEEDIFASPLFRQNEVLSSSNTNVEEED